MKIRSFSIKNFKSLENVSVSECSDFHALIGANSAGKTSIFDALNIIKLIGNDFPNIQLVTKGIQDFDSMTNLSSSIKEQLKSDFILEPNHPKKQFKSLSQFCGDFLKIVRTDRTSSINGWLSCKCEINGQFISTFNLPELY